MKLAMSIILIWVWVTKYFLVSYPPMKKKEKWVNVFFAFLTIVIGSLFIRDYFIHEELIKLSGKELSISQNVLVYSLILGLWVGPLLILLNFFIKRIKRWEGIQE